MITTTPVYTIENECQDCYKCVRHCHCKAIRIVHGKASVIPENCVSCGECVKVCPSHAKKIRRDLPRLQQLLGTNAKLYASIAPSFTAYFPGTTIGQLATALKKLGFAGVAETAIGAQAVSHQTAEFLKKTDLGLAISSACPACVDYIRKYLPQYTENITPLYSPILAHCRILKEQFGEDAKVIFIGPCAAKKNEADRNPDILSLAITFAVLEELLDENGIVPAALEESPLITESAEEGRFYAIEGGMNDTLRDENVDVRYISVSGLDNLDRILRSYNGTRGKRKLFLEALACPGGCINGPVIPAGFAGSLDVIAETDKISTMEPSSKRNVTGSFVGNFKAEPLPENRHSERELTIALTKVGKYSQEDELNCGACGYSTCREFAAALLSQKAEAAMCHTYLRKNFERTSSALIRFIPAAVVMVDENLEICECNRNFAAMSEMTEVYDTIGNLNSIPIDSTLPGFSDLFASVISNGGEIEKFNQKFNDKIVNISVFSIARGKSAGAVIQDITKNELQREQIAEKAREVIRKNVLTVQQVARLFGEHVADTEILLNEIAGTYERRGGK
ncbi:MAG: 4Fe-4S binding protein [Kiritimatiellae bacterium]|nr:4Fe-4S binding protein [Kiritimatiellia bacterium]